MTSRVASLFHGTVLRASSSVERFAISVTLVLPFRILFLWNVQARVGSMCAC